MSQRYLTGVSNKDVKSHCEYHVDYYDIQEINVIGWCVEGKG